MFLGYIFEKSRSNGEEIKVKAYDQLRYLKSKDTYNYDGITYSTLLQRLAGEYQLKTGTIEDTKYLIPARIEECTVLDMLQNASDETLLNTGNLFILYDDYGKLSLRHVENLITNYYIDEDTADSYEYKTSIDQDVYTQFKIAYDDSSDGVRKVAVYNDTDLQTRLGVLTYYEKWTRSTNNAVGDFQKIVAGERTKTLMKYYKKIHRELSLKGCFGNTSVRAGFSVIVKMNLGDMLLSNRMLVEECTHNFKNGAYTMDMKLSGYQGEFTA